MCTWSMLLLFYCMFQQMTLFLFQLPYFPSGIQEFLSAFQFPLYCHPHQQCLHILDSLRFLAPLPYNSLFDNKNQKKKSLNCSGQAVMRQRKLTFDNVLKYSLALVDPLHMLCTGNQTQQSKHYDLLVYSLSHQQCSASQALLCGRGIIWAEGKQPSVTSSPSYIFFKGKR